MKKIEASFQKNEMNASIFFEKEQSNASVKLMLVLSFFKSGSFLGGNLVGRFAQLESKLVMKNPLLMLFFLEEVRV